MQTLAQNSACYNKIKKGYSKFPTSQFLQEVSAGLGSCAMVPAQMPKNEKKNPKAEIFMLAMLGLVQTTKQSRLGMSCNSSNQRFFLCVRQYCELLAELLAQPATNVIKCILRMDRISKMVGRTSEATGGVAKSKGTVPITYCGCRIPNRTQSTLHDKDGKNAMSLSYVTLADSQLHLCTKLKSSISW